MSNSQVDCIVRLHDPSRLMELNRCLLSLYGQDYRPLCVIVVLQRFSSSDIERVHELVKSYSRLSDAFQYLILNYEDEQPRDARSHLLNLGISRASGRYIGFLDYDDTLYQNAYSLLVKKSVDADAAIVFSSVQAKNVEINDFFVFPREIRKNVFPGSTIKDLFEGNFCPIHSYLIDRKKIPSQTLFFDPSLSLEEDYDLLIRICSAHRSDFSLIGTIIGDYFFKDDGSNTTGVGVQAADASKIDTRYEWTSARMQARRVLCSAFPKESARSV